MAWGSCVDCLIIGWGCLLFTYMRENTRNEMTRLDDLYGEEYRQYAAFARSLLPGRSQAVYHKSHPLQEPGSFDLFL